MLTKISKMNCQAITQDSSEQKHYLQCFSDQMIIVDTYMSIMLIFFLNNGERGGVK